MTAAWSTGAPRRLLVVDDSATVRALVRVFLMGRAFEFVDAPNGEFALEIAARGGIAMAIVDFNMPKMDGLAFLRRVRADPALRAMRIVLLSADTSATLRRDAVLAGADAVLHKPISSARLVEAVDRLSPASRGEGTPCAKSS